MTSTQLLELLTPDVWFLSLLGGIAGALGILVDVYFRDKADIENKIPFFKGQDVYGIFIFFILGGFIELCLVVIKSQWTGLPAPAFFVPAWLFLPLVWTSFESNLPAILVRVWGAVQYLVGKKTGNDKG